jgi:hypothetical protein
MLAETKNYDHVIHTGHCSGLAGILARGTNAAIWLRDPPESITNWITAWPSLTEVDMDSTVTRDSEAERAIPAKLAEAGCPPGEGRAALAADITFLAHTFSRISGRPEARVRLETLRDHGCTKFHVDHLRLRLLCIYAGPGTEWVSNDQVNRSQLGNAEIRIEKANRLIVPQPGSINVLPTGAVMIFKGNQFQGDQHRGLVHRSHPVSAFHMFRLRLCIDEPDTSY